MTRFQLAIGSVLMAGAAIILVAQHRAQMALRQDNERLRRQSAQVALDKEQFSSRNNEGQGRTSPMRRGKTLDGNANQSQQESGTTNLIADLMNGGSVPLLNEEQLRTFLDENRRSATSLLAAYRTTGNIGLLQEAMERFPAEPQVAFEALWNKNMSEAQKREWLEAFKKAAPENGLADYLSALNHFKSGQKEAAVQDLTAASGKPRFSDYTFERIQENEEAYRAAGYSEADAKMAAVWGVTLPQLGEMRPLARNILALAEDYRKAGDSSSADAAMQTVIGLSQQLDASGANVPLVNRMVGIAVARLAFESLDPASKWGDSTVEQQLGQLTQRRDALKNMVRESTALQGRMTTEDWLSYNERTVRFGEENAITWLLGKYGQN